MLTSKNFFEFKNSLRNLIYFARWHASLIDVDQLDADNPWDGNEAKDEDEERDNRRNAFALLRMKVGDDLKHLLTNIRPGDCKALWKRIGFQDRFL